MAPKRTALETYVQNLMTDSETNRKERTQEYHVQLREAQLKRLRSLYSVLDLSADQVLNAACRYAFAVAKAKQKNIREVPGYPKRLGKTKVAFHLSPVNAKLLSETETPLEGQLVSAVVALGIDLLYQRLLKGLK